MHTLREKYGRWLQVFCFLFAVHIFNLSADPHDPQPDFIREDLSRNDIESIAEFVAEVVFGFTNAFEEHDEADVESGGIIDLFKTYCLAGGADLSISRNVVILRIQYFIFESENYSLLVHEISSPPPKA